MNQMKSKMLPLFYLLSIPALSTFYVLLNTPNRGTASLITAFDREIPFIKYFIVPYVSWYGFIFLTFIYLAIKDRTLYYKTLLSYNMGLIVCFGIYFVFQTTVPRPILAGDDIFIRLTANLYSSDQPYNCFPSIHVFTSHLMYLAIDKVDIKKWYTSIIIKVAAVTIIVSTLFVKQHVLLDVFGAILLADILFRFVYLIDGVKVPVWKKKPYSSLTMKKKLEI